MNFPILRLMRDQFEAYYTQRNGSDNEFKKLSFVFANNQPGTDYLLLCYPLKRIRQVMTVVPGHPIPMVLKSYPTGNVRPINSPFNLGTIELTYHQLASVIGEFNNIKADFSFLRFEADKNADSFIFYEVYFNDTTDLATQTRGNPCPPGSQN